MNSDLFYYLLAGRTVIADKKNWTQRTFARTTRGKRTGVEGPDAYKFCALGALQFVNEVPLYMSLQAELVLDKAAKVLFNYGIVTVNDKFDHTSILKVYDLALDKVWNYE